MSKRTFILADEKVNSYGFRLLMSGLKLERFKANPVALFNHISSGPDYTGPIGRWDNITLSNGKLQADFVADDKDEFAMKIDGKIERDFLRGASPGIEIFEFDDTAELKLEGQKYPTVIDWAVFESSVVDIPSGSGALRLRYKGEDYLIETEADMAKLGFSSTKTTQKQNDTMEFPENILTELGLGKGATDGTVLSAIQTLKAEKKTAEDKLKTDSEAAAKTFADGLKAELKLTDEKTESMRKLHMNDSSLALEAATLMRGGKKEEKQEQRRTLRDELGGGTPPAGGGNERDAWTMRDWEKKDPKGLLSMKRDQPEDYKTLFDSTYSK